MTASLWVAVVAGLAATALLLWAWYEDAPIRAHDKHWAAVAREWGIARDLTAADRDWLAAQHRIATGQEPPPWLDNRYHGGNA